MKQLATEVHKYQAHLQQSSDFEWSCVHPHSHLELQWKVSLYYAAQTHRRHAANCCHTLKYAGEKKETCFTDILIILQVKQHSKDLSLQLKEDNSKQQKYKMNNY